jgi:hypothetical protein
MQRRMVSAFSVMLVMNHSLKCNPVLKLSKEDEAAVGSDETEVRKEDQERINKFSRLHQREMLLEEELKVKAVSCIDISSKWSIGTDSHAERQRGPRGDINRARTRRRR